MPAVWSGAEIALGHRQQLGTASDSRLDKGDEAGTRGGVQRHLRGCGEGVVVGLRGGGGLGADHADPAGPGGGDGTAGRGEDHLDHRHRVALPGVAEHGGAGRVAGDDQCLDALVEQVVETLERVLTDLRDGLLAVRGPGGVPEVHDVLVRQLVDHGPRHRQTAEPGVEDPDRRLALHGRSA